MKQRGFTLIEVLVSVAILAFIMFAVYASISQSLDAKDRFERRDGIYHEGRVALRKLTDDLSMAFMIKEPRERVALAGIPSPGDTASMEIMTRPRPVTFFIAEDRGERDALRFTTLSNLRLFRNAKTTDQSKVHYEVRPSSEDPQVFDLVRTFSPRIDENDTVEGISYVLAENVREFAVEYYDVRKQEWVRSWDTTKIDWRERLPRAARVTLSFPDPDDERQSIVLTTAVIVQLSAGPIEF